MRSATDGAPSFVYVPGLAAAGDLVTLGDEEAHYLRRVVRIRAGETVTATDGAGLIAELVVVEAGPELRAEVRATRSESRACELELLCGAPEGDRADWMVEKLGELGVSVLRLVDTERGSWERAAQRASRWERLAVAALRQSRSAFRLHIALPEPLPAVLEKVSGLGAAYLADPDGRAFPAADPALDGRRRGAAVGPSGGFSAGERKRLEEKGFTPTRLTPARLRTETAAVAIAVLALSGTA